MWELIFIAVAKIATFILDKMKANEELKKRWFEFIKQAGEDLSSVRLFEYGKKAMDEFDNKPFNPT